MHKSLGDVCNVIGGGTPSKRNSAFYEGDIPWATVRDMRKEILLDTEFSISRDAVKNSSTNIIPDHNVVIATRVGLGKVCLLDQDTAINQDLRGIIPKYDNLDVRYLFRWLQSIADVIEGEGTGATVKGVKLPFIKSLQLPLPPVPEQKRIVAILDEAFAGIETAIANTEKNLANARELFESYLNSVFSQRGEGWQEKDFGEIADFKNGLNFTRNSKGELVRIVGVKDFKSNYWVPVDELATVQVDGQLNENYELREKDILIVRSNGNKQLIGRCLLIGTIQEKTSYSGFTIRARMTTNEVMPEFLAHFLKADQVREELIKSGGGTNISSLNQKALASLPVWFPTREQQADIVKEIIEINSETQHLESIYQQKLTALAELKQSLLQKAFSGELTSETGCEAQEAVA